MSTTNKNNNSGKTPISTRKPVQKKSTAQASGNQPKPKSPPSKGNNTVRLRMEFARDEIMLDDTSMITDILVTQKTLVKRYGNALCEGSCQRFRGIVNNHLGEIAEDQFDSFTYMQQNDLYPTEPAPAPKVSEAKQKFKNTEQKMKR